jgi:hypothetical protein
VHSRNIHHCQDGSLNPIELRLTTQSSRVRHVPAAAEHQCVGEVSGGVIMALSIPYEANLFPAAVGLDSSAPAAVTGEAAAKPGLFLRVLGAIGRSYYVEAPDGEVYFFLPPA